MKNFTYKTALVSLLFITIMTLFITYGKMIYNSPEYPMWKSTMDYISTNTNNHNIIIGDSRALVSFSPKQLDDNYYNLAVGGGTPIEGYYFLKKLLTKKTPKKLILSFAPCHLECAEIFYDRTLKYNLLSKKEIDEVLSISKKLNEKFYIPDENRVYTSTTDYYKEYLTAMVYSSNCFTVYRPELSVLLYTPSRPFKNFDTYKEINTNGGSYHFGTANSSSQLNIESTTSTFLPSKVINHYLNKTLDLTTQYGIEVYYITAPFNLSSYQNTTSNYITEYNLYFNKLKQQHPNITWYSDISFLNNNCFGDPSHLNTKGVQEYSKHLKNSILK